jgi:hypothetical protein
LRRAPFAPGLFLQTDEHHVRFEGRVEPLVPIHQIGQNRQIGRFQNMQARAEIVGNLTFVHKGGDLPFAHGQLRAVLNFIAGRGNAPCNLSWRFLPFDHVDELFAQEIKHVTHPKLVRQQVLF